MFTFSSGLAPYFIPPNEDDWSMICPSEESSRNPDLACAVQMKTEYGMDPAQHNCTTVYGPSSNFSLIPHNMSHCIDWNLFYSSCMDLGQNPEFDAISFDNSGVAFIAIFQVRDHYFTTTI